VIKVNLKLLPADAGGDEADDEAASCIISITSIGVTGNPGQNYVASKPADRHVRRSRRGRQPGSRSIVSHRAL
jgi:hypothetical protein